jgi:YidC/Oxa1 family membrane protein insertase
MEKNTILAVVLSTLVLIVFYVVQGVFFPSPAAVEPVTHFTITEQESQQAVSPQAAEQQTTGQVSPQPSILSELFQQPAVQQVVQETGPQAVQYITIETDLLTVVFTNAGGNVVSWKLKDHFDKDDNVDMIFSGTNEAQAFSIAFGGLDAQPITSLFYVNRLSEYSIEFYRYFPAPGTNETFRLSKRYDLKQNDYMFELTISIEGGSSFTGLNLAGNAYTLSFGPQIGPRFERLANHFEDFRQYYIFTDGRRRNAKVNDPINSLPRWAAISGKYFAFIAVPLLHHGPYEIVFTETPEPGVPSTSRFNITRPAISAHRATDHYRFFLGPKSQEVLALYNTGRNEFGLRDMQLVEVASTRGILAPLERLLKWLLFFFYGLVPNYGVAIILLTLLVKILFFPLTKKGSEATLRMQALAPKIKELQEKYKDNRQKLNAEMAAFYQKEGYNPISGCLPMLLQLPIFFAMYSLFNNHFELRGAQFIPGWIPDLSVPEAIWNFPEGVRLPFLGWTALRALPFIYVGSQLLYGKVTQLPGQQSNPQMKMMLYVMPIVFFFILYNVPSGLLIYWIFSNLLTLVQQVIINRYVMAKRAQNASLAATASSRTDDKRTGTQNVIAPRNTGTKKKKKK